MRKSVTIKVGEEGGRDKDKTFVVTEMDADAADRWARRALHALMKNGIDVPADIAEAGLPGIASFGFKAIGAIPPEDSDEIIARLMACVAYLPNPATPEIWRGVNAREGATAPSGPLFANDIEELKTRYRLQAEAFELVTGFSMAAVRSLLTKAPAPKSPA